MHWVTLLHNKKSQHCWLTRIAMQTNANEFQKKTILQESQCKNWRLVVWFYAQWYDFFFQFSFSDNHTQPETSNKWQQVIYYYCKSSTSQKIVYIYCWAENHTISLQFLLRLSCNIVFFCNSFAVVCNASQPTVLILLLCSIGSLNAPTITGLSSRHS